MLDALGSQDSPQRKGHDFQIEAKRLRSRVLGVVTYFHKNIQFVAAIDLRPTGDSRNQAVHSVPRAQRDQIVLIKKRGPGTDQTQVSLTDAGELGQLVEAGAAQPASNGSQIALRLLQKMSCKLRGMRAHGAEFRHLEKTIISAHAFGPMECGTRRSESHRHPAEKQKGGAQNEKCSAKNQVDRALPGRHRTGGKRVRSCDRKCGHVSEKTVTLRRRVVVSVIVLGRVLPLPVITIVRTMLNVSCSREGNFDK